MSVCYAIPLPAEARLISRLTLPQTSACIAPAISMVLTVTFARMAWSRTSFSLGPMISRPGQQEPRL